MLGSKNDSSKTQTDVLRFLLLEICCVILMVLDSSNRISTPIRSAVSTLTYPLQKVIELPQNAWKFLSSAVSDHFQLLNENVTLKKQLSEAQIELLQMEVISQQNQELRKLLEAKQQLPLKTTAAFLININTGSDTHKIVINQGSNQGVKQGQTVLDLHGVLGQVEKTSLESSHIILITDINHAVPVEFLRTGIRTILYGTGDMDILSLPEIPQSADIKEGDILITSGFGGIFPRGLKVATIEKILDSKGDHSFQQALAKPSANMNNLKQVLLVWEDEQTIQQKAESPP